MSNQYDRFNSMYSEFLSNEKNNLVLKTHHLAAYIWENAIDYANSTGFPNTLGFLQYIWAGLYFCVHDILLINGIEYMMKDAFTETTSAIFHIQENEKYMFSSILKNQEFIFEKLSTSTISSVTKEGIIAVQDTVLFLASIDLDDESFVPDAQQEFEFIMAATAVMKHAVSIFPKGKPSYSPSKSHSSQRNNASEKTDKDSRIYYVTSFDGQSFRIPGSSIDEFHRRNKENESIYFQKYSHLRGQLFDYLRNITQEFLNSYAPVHNRESFMLLSTAILCVASSLSKHYATVKIIKQDILEYSINLPKDRFCLYFSVEKLRDKQVKWVQSLIANYKLDYQCSFYKEILKDERTLKKYAKEVFQTAAPRSHYGLKAQKAMVALLHEFDKFAASLTEES